MKTENIAKIYGPLSKTLREGISTDIVILGYHDKCLKILLQRPRGLHKWSLAGGFIEKGLSAESAAQMIVQRRTGLKNLSLFQFGVYSEPGRLEKDKTEILRYADIISRHADGDLWLFNDVVSIAFCALIDFEKAEIVSDQDVEECRWWDINDLPELLYDHNQMVAGALEYLRVRCYLKPIGKGLLPEKFTLPDLKSVYETLLRKKLDDRNFSKKMLHIGLIEKLTERKSIGPHRSPFMYRFNEETYERLTKDGSIMIIS